MDSGRLRANITSHVDFDAEGIRGTVELANVEYGPYVEEGTAEHTITPKRAKALRFTPRGGTQPIFRKKATIPAREGAHMFRDGGEAAEPEIDRRFDLAIDRAIQRMG